MTLHRTFLGAAAFALAFISGTAPAQVLPPPENVVQLAATAAVEVPQDLLAIQLSATREGADPAAIQTQLKAALEQALAEARKAVQPGQVDVRTGQFNISPRYNRDGRIAAWVGTAELIVEGSDTARVAQLAGRLPGMTVASAAFRLSREKRERAEQDAQAQAVAHFRARAAELARAFGFNSYSLREVSVQAMDPGVPRPMRMAIEAKAAADAPVPVEAGRTTVTVNVSGSVQLR